MSGRRDLADLQAPGRKHLTGPPGRVPRLRDVDLVEGDDPWPPGQVRPGGLGVGREFRLDGVQVRHGIPVRLPGRARSAVEHVDQHDAAFHVAQEVQAEPLAAAGAGNQPGHVGHHVLGFAGLHDAQVRGERRERVVRDLRPGRGHGRDQRGLACVGEANQARVGHGLQFQDQGVLGARFAAQGESGGPAPRRGKGRVAEPAPAALRGHEPGPGADQVGEHLAVRRLDHGAVGDGHDQVRPVGAAAVRSRALLAVARAAHRPAVQVEQRGHARVHLENDVAAAASVAAVGAAERLELLPVHRRAAVPAVTRLHLDGDVVGKLGHC